MYIEKHIDIDAMVETVYLRIWERLAGSLYDKNAVNAFIRRTVEDVLIENGLTPSKYEIESSFDFKEYKLNVSVYPKCPGINISEVDGNIHDFSAEYRESMYWWLVNQYGEDIGVELSQAVYSRLNQHEAYNVDNWRTAKIGDVQATFEYNEARAKGCCGSADFIVNIDGVGYKIGFNYGH